MKRSALQDKAVCPVRIDILNLTDFSSDLVVIGPRKVKPVIQSSPGVEFPVHTADLSSVVYDKCGAAVANPGIVVGHLHHADMIRQLRSAVLIL